ncbi:glycosyltransferase [Fulvivirgaceae bacterium PWU4]|uniref:Glycosyltransferase n=1 Tax=Chryseosolibacter histidini TaxID=2782349 RepID=A0AAP2DQ95_9BACT|nr:glycosyltransferase [Chryseosolibacter histidini]MBT1700531.1 glycosyltransferase [Chryseosolibacter histidini]
MATPLVSVIVTSYNSARFIVETLESVKAQTYQNIELIISDDCSTDDTVAVGRAWLEKNGSRFVRTDLITVPQNTGVSANCNRCIKASRAEWIKFIAGDDILLPNCIEDNMSFVMERPEVKILFSQVALYADNFHEKSFLRILPAQFPVNIMKPELSADDQFRLLLISDRISFTPSYFFNKQALTSVGGYDERHKVAEDYPMWLKLTHAGFRLYFMMKLTVGYRQHGQALNNIGNQQIFKPLLLKTHFFRKEFVYPYLPWDIIGQERFVILVSRLFQSAGLNKNKAFQKTLYKFLTVYLNPFQYAVAFKKRVLGKGKHDVFYSN